MVGVRAGGGRELWDTKRVVSRSQSGQSRSAGGISGNRDESWHRTKRQLGPAEETLGGRLNCWGSINVRKKKLFKVQKTGAQAGGNKNRKVS